MGTKGWGTIPPRSGPFIRPLLGVGRDVITAYADAHRVPFREDASNHDPKYLRNRVRYELIPLLEDLRPGARGVLARNVVLLRELAALAGQGLDALVPELSADEHGARRIPFTTILDSGAPHALLARLPGISGFHPERIVGIVRAIREGRTGAHFQETEADVWVDRDVLIITVKAQDIPEWTIVSPGTWPTDAPLSLAAGSGADIDPSAGPDVVWLDADAAAFPWTLRPWRPGDRMRPRGLNGSKLVSDILIDAKVPREAKRRTYVLESRGAIMWCCGLRLADGFAARPTTPNAWRCTWRGE
jgi:tRNA(Ile)-lysidine synthase